MWRNVGWHGAWLSWPIAMAALPGGWVPQAHSWNSDHQEWGGASGKDRQQGRQAQATLPQLQPGRCEGRE